MSERHASIPSTSVTATSTTTTSASATSATTPASAASATPTASEPYRVCVVCWGNICRSPMGEFLLREAFADAGLADRVIVDSAGTSAEESGNGMHPRTAAVLRRNGHRDAGWRQHVARRFERSWFDRYDLVLPVDHVHVERLHGLARDAADLATVRLFRSFDPDAVASGEIGMDDPWYGTDPAYDQTYAEITAAVPGILEFVRRELEGRDRG